MIVQRISMRSTVNPTDNYVESYADTKLPLLLMRHIPDSADCLYRQRERKRENGRGCSKGTEKEECIGCRRRRDTARRPSSSSSLSSTSAYSLSRRNKQLGQRKPNGAIRRTDYVRKPAKRKDIRAIDKRINRRE